MWAFVLVSALAALHLYQTLQYSTMLGVADDDDATTLRNTRSYFDDLQARAAPPPRRAVSRF